MQVNRKDNQTLFDIILAHTGSIDAVMNIAISNNIAVTDLPVLVEINQEADQEGVVDYFLKHYEPVTGGDYSEPAEDGDGTSQFVDVSRNEPEDLYEVRDQQNWFDIALMLYGGVEAAFDLAILNNMELTSDLVNGIPLKKKGIAKADGSIVKAYNRKGIKPATAYIESLEGGVQEGIGYWAIEIDFAVS